MSEIRLPIVDVSGQCRGVTGEVFPPLDVRVVADQRDTTVVCDLLSANGKCDADTTGQATCIFLARNAVEESIQDSVLRCDTPAGTLIYDASSRDVIASPLFPQGHEQVTLTRSEGDMLAELMRNQGLVLSRNRLISTFRDSDYLGDSRSVDVHMARLRKNIGQTENHRIEPNKQVIQTVRSRGYKIPILRTG